MIEIDRETDNYIVLDGYNMTVWKKSDAVNTIRFQVKCERVGAVLPVEWSSHCSLGEVFIVLPRVGGTSLIIQIKTTSSYKTHPLKLPDKNILFYK